MSAVNMSRFAGRSHKDLTILIPFRIVSLLPINQSISLFLLTLAEDKITISMKILKVKIRVLAAWNNHRG